MGIYGINISREDFDSVLNYLDHPRSKFDVMVKFDMGASKVYNLLNACESAGELRKIKTSTGRVLFVVSK